MRRLLPLCGGLSFELYLYQMIPRESAEFIPTMIANLRRGYRLELRPADAP